MSFHTIEFLIFFLPAVMLLFYLLFHYDQTEKRVWVKGFLIVVSLLFYGQLGVRGLCILAISVLANYLLGCLSGKTAKAQDMQTPEESAARPDMGGRILLIIGLICNIGMLAGFKVYAGGTFAPLGISFYTFSQIAYLMDAYRKRVRIGFLDYLLSIVLFAKIAEGPMMTPAEFVEKNPLTAQSEQIWKNLNRGLFLLAIGLAKKLFLADAIARFADAGFGMSAMTVVEAWVSSIAYSMELYFDFSGYCDMAIGIALMLQIELPMNFNSPYRALDFEDFWKRWHMTLTSFLTKYLYYPLGGNRRGRTRTYLNIMVVFAVSGIWHGIGITFLLWGLLHGITLVLCKICRTQIAKVPKFIRWGVTFVLVNAYWVLFRAESFAEAIVVWKGMAKVWTVKLFFTPEYMTRLKLIAFQNNKITLGILVAACLIAFLLPNSMQLAEKSRKNVGMAILIAGILLAAVFLISTQNAASSLYFNF